MLSYLTAIVLVGSFAFAACNSGHSPAPPTQTLITIVATLTPISIGSTPTSPAPTPTGAPSVDSGIEGSVTIGPTCPVQRVDSPCADRPYEATILVLDSDGKQVTETRSGADGRFRVVLQPGVYTLSPLHGGTPPTAAQQTVTVVPGRITTVQIVFDSGIR